jgi:AcrR family transcriptional regulator
LKKLNAAFHNTGVALGEQATVESRTVRGRGRPPNAAAHRAVLDATRELLSRGDLAHLNLEQVAEHAGVSKATIYRHWRTREGLALEVLSELTGHMTVRDRGDARSELIAMVEGTLRILTRTQLGTVMQGLLSELARNPAIGRPFRETVVGARRAAVAEVFRRGMQHRQIRADADIDLATELLMGPIYYRLVFGGPFPPDFAQRVVDAVLTGFNPRVAEDTE